MSGSEKKVNKIKDDISSIKRVTKKFLEVSRCYRAKKINAPRKCATRAKFFFANWTYCCFSPFSGVPFDA